MGHFVIILIYRLFARCVWPHARHAGPKCSVSPSFIQTSALVRPIDAQLDRRATDCLFSRLVPSGGAERLIVDAVVELKSRGHDVQLYTAHHDPKRCFRETLVGALELCPGCAPLALLTAVLQEVHARHGYTCTHAGCLAPCLDGYMLCVLSFAAPGLPWCCLLSRCRLTRWSSTKLPVQFPS